MPAAVLFRGKEPVIRAYMLNNTPTWSIYVMGKIFTFCPAEIDTIEEGAAALSSVLDMLTEGTPTSAPLELRCHVDPKFPIVNNSPFSSAFGFKLEESTEETHVRGMGSILKGMADRMDALERRMSEEPEEPEIPAWQSAIAGIVQRPEVLQYVMGKVIGIIEGIFPTKRPASVAGVPQEQGEQVAENPGTLYDALAADQRAALDQAMPILMSKDPQVGTNLLKIARILDSDPKKYGMFAAML